MTRGCGALGATDRIPSDGEQFQTVVRAALAVAAQSPYKDELATYGFTSAKRIVLTQMVDTLEIRRQSVVQVKERALHATRERDAAATELQTYLLPLERALRLIERLG